ncbi:MAG: DCC1-like thiol-disulfide oxidoreductase family protein, partial [Candidatus Caenarcaniphilales bacterium]|nr:DCC1-like thiol-disulfide oxidoreductase family protein [Candidatus Caenarcaniphilales bacterium]
MPNNPHYTLLFDGQCVICRHLVDEYIKPKKPEELAVKPYQEAEFDKAYPEEQLQRCKKEILLINEEKQEFMGGVAAVSKTLELTKQFEWLQIILNIAFPKPFTWFAYRMVAWHRYSWFIVPPYLRCSECEIEIPKIWNFIFFALLGSITLGANFYFCYTWFNSLRGAAPILFSLIKREPLFLTLISVLACSAWSLSLQGLFYFTNKKTIGIPRIESSKQFFIVNTKFSLLLAAATPLSVALATWIAANTSALRFNLIFILLSCLYLLTL